MALYPVAVNTDPVISDINQIIDLFNGNHDVGLIQLAPQVLAPTSAPTAALASATSGLGVGAYTYTIAFVTGYKKSDGTIVKTAETNYGPTVNISTTSGNQSVQLSNIPTSSSPSVVARSIYRTPVGGGPYKFVAMITDNTTTTYLDNLRDINLGNVANSSNQTGTPVNFGSWVSSPNNIYSSAVGVASQSIPASTDTGITLSPTGLGLAGDSSWSTSSWTCPIAGIYLVGMNAYFTPAASSLFQVKLYVNSALDQFLISDYIASAQSICRAGIALKKLNAGDTIRFYANAGATAGTFNGNYSRLAIVKIG